MPNSCICCGHVKGKKDKVSMYRFPSDKAKRQLWLVALNLTESDITDHTRICSRHFLHGNSSNVPSFDLGRRFASPKKISSERSARALKRSQRASSAPIPILSKRALIVTSPSGSCASSTMAPTPGSTTDNEPMSASAGEQLFSDYSVHELPSTGESAETNVALLTARVEFLESETKYLRSVSNVQNIQYFRLEQIAENDSLIRFYTGFVSYALLLNFFEFLGPSVYQLNYWGDSKRKTTRRRKNMALTPLNQFFLTLIKLRLNLQMVDLSIRFGISTPLVSKYFNTWVCFLYQHLKEIDWTPSVEQVSATLPCAFQKLYPTTYSILDASELFIETPSDLFIQSSTWSSYKHHNTAKFLIGCTPNGVVSYVSPLYVGSVSDVELTKVSGYLDTLDGKAGSSVMADRGFTVRDLLAEKGVGLNIPPFMQGRKQLSEADIQRGRHIASLRIHVERTIGRIKNYSMLKGVLPISMIRIANQILSVCEWLTNFQPAMIPLPGDSSVEEVEEYFQSLESDYDYDADSEMTDDDDTD